MQEDFEGCAQAFHQAEEIAPDDPITQAYLGRLYLRQRRWPEAELAFRRALDADQDLAEAHYGLSVAASGDPIGGPTPKREQPDC